MQCDICDYEFRSGGYGKHTCPHCGQEYEWEEGYFPILTQRQKDLLRKDRQLEAYAKESN